MFIAWLAGAWKSESWKAGAWASENQPVAVAGSARLRRKRVFIDGKAYFISPQEAAQLLIARATTRDASEVTAPEIIKTTPVVDYEAIKTSSVKASREFIDRMSAEIERMRVLAHRRTVEEEDDIECLMLLLA